jgi:hypothetical protein
MLYVDAIAPANKEKAKELLKKLRPPLVTLLSKEPEIQYVALRNLSLICQRHLFPRLYVFSHDVIDLLSSTSVQFLQLDFMSFSTVYYVHSL